MRTRIPDDFAWQKYDIAIVIVSTAVINLFADLLHLCMATGKYFSTSLLLRFFCPREMICYCIGAMKCHLFSGTDGNEARLKKCRIATGRHEGIWPGQAGSFNGTWECLVARVLPYRIQPYILCLQRGTNHGCQETQARRSCHE